LHCKNWKVRLNKETNIVQIIVYDCGICFQNISLKISNDFWFALVKYDVKGIKNTLKQFITNNTLNNTINDKLNNKFEEGIDNLFYNILNQNMSTSLILKIILKFFSENNIIIHKFLLNFSILICVIEEFLKKNNFIDKQKKLKKTSMFEIINDCELDIIAFCDVKKCYPKVRDLFNMNMENKYIHYKENIIKNNIQEDITCKKKLFSSLSLSTLKFRPPE